jgi:hypothetical protein
VTIGFTYDDTDRLGRIRISISGFSALADYAVVERSTDQVNWSVVRGGDSITLTAGSGSLDDYEFTANTLNYYRATGYNTAGGHLVGVGAASHADNASVAPAVPAGIAAGDTLIIVAANSDITASVNTPSGWTLRRGIGNYAMFYKIATSSESAPTVSFTGSGAGDSCSAQMAAFRFIDIVNRIGSSTHQASTAQNIAVPGVTLDTAPLPRFVLMHGWKQDDWTSVDNIPGFTEIGEPSTTLGLDQGMVWSFTNTPGTVPSQTFVVNGGSSALNYGGMQIFPTVYTNRETQSITPTVTRFRIKSPTRPSLNTFFEPLEDELIITRPARTGLFDVLSRTMPVAVTDLQGSRRFSMRIDVKGDSNRADMDNRLSTGAVYFLQPPDPGGAMPTMYFVLGDVEHRMDTEYFSDSYTFTLSLIEVAKPPFTVYGNTNTWADVVADFATWADLLAAESTWSDVVDLVADSDVIVP